MCYIQSFTLSFNEGFPILYPETHMSMRRNLSAVDSSKTTSSPSGIPIKTSDKNNNSNNNSTNTNNNNNNNSTSSGDSSEETITTESMGQTPKGNGTNATSGTNIIFKNFDSPCQRKSSWEKVK